jgi:hypothetical protein
MLPRTNNVLRRFNRDTKCLVAGLLGAVVFAALAFAVLVPESHPKTADLTKQERQARSDFLLNVDAVTPFRIVDLNAKRSTSETTSGPATNVDQGFAEISSKKGLARIEADAASTPPPVLVFSPEISRTIAQANASEWSPVHRQDSARLFRAKIPPERFRWSGRLRAVDVKTRLIALWRQSLLRSEKPRSWVIFSNLNRKKKAAYTAGREP